MGNHESECQNDTNTKTNVINDITRFTTNNKIRKLLNHPSHSGSHTVTQSSTFTSTPSTATSTPEPPFSSLKITKLTQHDRLAQLAADFWRDNIESLDMKHKLEVACSVWFGMTASDMEIHRLLLYRFKTNNDFEMAAFRNLDMIGFVIRSLYASNTNLSSLLYKLGALHSQFGIKWNYYHIMWLQLNQTLKYYFPQKYTTQIEFAMSEAFSYTVHAMSGYDMKVTTPCNDISFLQSLRCCITHTLGKEYLFRFLINVYCDEVVIFFRLLCLVSTYKASKHACKRYEIAQNICTTCIAPEGVFCVNICYDVRQRLSLDASVMDTKNVDIHFFGAVEDELCRLIMQTHWETFKAQINRLYSID